jgi:hypothetical protein
VLRWYSTTVLHVEVKSGVHHLRIHVNDNILDIIVYYILLFEIPLCMCGAIRSKYDTDYKQMLVK